eukprot:scaffold2644_cov63-Phaeocystis_antarctica.AAC.1
MSRTLLALALASSAAPTGLHCVLLLITVADPALSPSPLRAPQSDAPKLSTTKVGAWPSPQHDCPARSHRKLSHQPQLPLPAPVPVPAPAPPLTALGTATDSRDLAPTATARLARRANRYRPPGVDRPQHPHRVQSLFRIWLLDQLGSTLWGSLPATLAGITCFAPFSPSRSPARLGPTPSAASSLRPATAPTSAPPCALRCTAHRVPCTNEGG